MPVAALTPEQIHAARTGRLPPPQWGKGAALVADINRRWDEAERIAAADPELRTHEFRPNGTPRSVCLPHPWMFERTPAGGWRICNVHTLATVHVRGPL